jgi:hypothetical protein
MSCVRYTDQDEDGGWTCCCGTYNDPYRTVCKNCDHKCCSENVFAKAGIFVGTRLHGFCGGYFGRDSYGEKVVEAVGSDWIVVREEDGTPNWAYVFDGWPTQEEMLEWTKNRGEGK